MKRQLNLTIRRFKKRDAYSVSKVIQKTMMESNIADYPLSILQPLHDYFTPFKVEVLAGERYCLVVMLETELIATGAYEAGELKTVFVLPAYQGKGIGKQLILELETQARKEGLKKMKVPASISGVPFYENLGYKKIKTFQSKNAGQQNLMEKLL